jgi:hypothetical protein
LKNLIPSSLILFFLSISAVHAEAPFIDYQWAESPDACLERAKDAMIDSGFKITVSTEANEIVGQNGDYKGVVACVGEAGDIAVFIVSGHSYPRSRQLAVKLKKKFLQ